MFLWLLVAAEAVDQVIHRAEVLAAVALEACDMQPDILSFLAIHIQ